MTKKHYIAIANIINNEIEANFQMTGADGKVSIAVVALKDVAGEMARFFADDNKNFDQAQFLEACFK